MKSAAVTSGTSIMLAPGNTFVYQETPDASRQELRRVSSWRNRWRISSPTMRAKKAVTDVDSIARFHERRTAHIALQEWDEIRPRLADDEVIDVEQLGDA